MATTDICIKSLKQMSDSINMKFRVKLKVIILSVLVQFFPSVCFSDSFELEGEILNVPDTCSV